MMITAMLRLVFLPLLLVVSACATVDTREEPKPTQPVGLVVGTVTFERSIGMHAPVLTDSSGKRVALRGIGSGMWYPGLKEEDADLKEKGGSYSVQLPAGDYRITGWEIKRARTTYTSAQAFEIPFTVEAGKAVYLGNLHFDVDWENVSLRDRGERDLPILRKQQKALADFPLSRTIAKGTDIRSLGNGYVGRSEMPIYLPPPR